MLTRLKEGDVDYVIIHKIDRLARNRGDDVTIMVEITNSGARLVSVTENVDETPAGKLMHGMLATFAEYYSSNLASEARKGLQEKVNRGGTPGYAPLGYRNIGQIIDGFETRCVELDPDRAPHVRWAFETYATGDWSITSIRDALEERGMVSRKTKTQVGTPLSGAQVHRILTHPYYKGYIKFKGALYPGKHEPLVDETLWQRVQNILAERRIAGDRSWRHTHFLKGVLHCARCQGGIGYGHSQGRGGVYEYFFCLGRHTGRTDCDLPYLAVPTVEKEVAQLWHTTRFTATFIDEVRENITTQLAATDADNQALLVTQRRRQTQLKRQNEKLLDAYMADAITVESLKQRQDLIQVELAQAAQLIEDAEQDAAVIHDRVDTLLKLLSHGHKIYDTVDDLGRQLLNQAVYETILVDARADEGRNGYTSYLAAAPHTQVVAALLAATTATSPTTAHEATQAATEAGEGLTSALPAGQASGGGERRVRKTPAELSSDGGSNVHHLAEGVGFEPTVRLHGLRFSRPARSTTLPPLRSTPSVRW